MPTHFEETLQRDIDRIRARISEMAELDQRALRDGLRALQERNRQLAYAVILRDQRIDELDKEIDGLCLQFLVRQQPVAGPLRFVYATIRINLELERVGDYAESIARQVIKLLATNVEVPTERFAEIAHLSIPMLHDAVRAFITQDAELAKETMEVEEAVDLLRHSINGELVAWREQDKIPIEGLTALMTIARRFERVSDQAKNICQEVIYMCTGEYSRHKAHGVFRLLFVDEDNACRSQMAEGIGTALHLPQFVFSSAGQDPKPIDPRVVSFMQQKGIDISGQRPKRIGEVPDLEHHHVFVGLAKDVQKALPPPPRKTVYLDWTVPDPSRAKGSPEQINAAYESTYREIEAHIRDLVGAIVGEEIEIQNKTYA